MKAYIDSTETLGLQETNGAITQITRLVKVVGMTQTDYSVLMAALEAVGVPAYGDPLPGIGFEGLRCVDRNPSIVDKDSGTVNIELVYKDPIASQTLGGSNSVLYGTARASIVQKKTNFYIPYGGSVQPQQPRQQITVSHTFPDDDPDFPGRTVVQGGEIDIFDAEANYFFEAFLNTNDPWGAVRRSLRHTNSNTWQSQPPFCWMCTEVQFNMVKPGRYRYRFEFQLNLDGWDPEVVFIDERTNRPPSGLVEGEGYKRIPYYPRANYTILYGQVFEGFQSLS